MLLAQVDRDSQGTGQFQNAGGGGQHITFCLAAPVSVPVGGQTTIGNMNTVSLQPVTFADGSTAFIQQAPAETYSQSTLQALRLANGTTAYVQDPVQMPQSNTIVATQGDGTLSDFSDGAIDPETLSVLEQYASKVDADKPATNSGVVETKPDEAVPIQIKVQNHREGCSSRKIVNCDYAGCGKSNPTAYHLKAHERWHTDGKYYMCNVSGCEKKYGTREGLKSHLKVHTGERPYHCPEPTCRKSFMTSGAITAHVRTHTGERRFVCPFEGCGRAFISPDVRKVHIRKHTGERPYRCQEPGCERTFISNNNYRNHVRIHTGEKPYLCTVPGCEKRFTEYSSLYKHQTVHIPFNPYSCSHCGKSYRKISSLANHKRTAHKDTELMEEEQEA